MFSFAFFSWLYYKGWECYFEDCVFIRRERWDLSFVSRLFFLVRSGWLVFLAWRAFRPYFCRVFCSRERESVIVFSVCRFCVVARPFWGDRRDVDLGVPAVVVIR